MNCQRVVRVGDYGRLCKFKAREGFDTCTLHRNAPDVYHYKMRCLNYRPNDRPVVAKVRGKKGLFSGPSAYAYPPKNWFVAGKLDLTSE